MEGLHEDALPRDAQGRPAGRLIGPEQGAVRGFSIGLGFYDNHDYLAPGVHDDQEGFYVLAGTGTAQVGGAEFTIRPGAAFLAPAGVPHRMKRDRGSVPLRVLYAHGAV